MPGQCKLITAKHFLLIVLASLIVSSGPFSAYAAGGGGAPDPGNPGTDGNGAVEVWNYAGKKGIGTSYERYLSGAYSDGGATGTISKVWFSIAQGIVTETAWGKIHEGQIKDLQFLVTGTGFFDEEKVATDSTIEYLHTDGSGRPLSLAYKITNTDKQGKYQIVKHVFTDPNRQALFMRVIFTAFENGITPYILINPAIANTGNQDVAYVGTNYLNARNVADDRYLSLQSSAPFIKTSAGFVGITDGYTDLNNNGIMDWQYDWADSSGGNVAMMAQLVTVNTSTVTFDVVVGFGTSHTDANAQASASLAEGYASVLDKYNGIGSHIGWEDYIAGLANLPSMTANTGDNGKLLYASALALKAMEDKTHAGALIASLSVPWGDTVSADNFATGYRAVWPRDFYQCAMALLAMGDTETPRVSFEYLNTVQVKSTTPGNSGATGWFLQKTHVDGNKEWIDLQMDQTAMPIMLGWKLWKAGVLSSSDINSWYATMLKPAADFLSNGGNVSIDGNNYTVNPPWTKNERWEEQQGYSPSTVAAVITGLVVAADIARNAGQAGTASSYEAKADHFVNNIDSSMFTTTGNSAFGDGRYYLRITKNTNPNDGDNLDSKNGHPATSEKNMLDAGFLELVRYGVRSPLHPSITESLPEIDNMGITENLRVKYEFNFSGTNYPGWRRYGDDGYGERTSDGGNWVGNDSSQRGRVWPIFTGERGHYELEKTKAINSGTISNAQVAALRDTYVRAMEHFANDGLMLPEQVWDGVGSNATHNYSVGEGTNSATPLAWSHAEYVKLVRSLTDRNTWDSYSIVRARYP